MIQFFVIGAGGFIGATARYYLSSFISQNYASKFPFGTVTVNLAGCFFLGFIAALTEEKIELNPTLKGFLTTGILGAFTTFSTFSVETVQLLRDGHLNVALLNVGVSVIVGVCAAYTGLIFARSL